MKIIALLLMLIVPYSVMAADTFILAPAVQLDTNYDDPEWTNPNAYDNFVRARFGLVLEDFLISPNLSLPSFSVLFFPLTNETVWEYGATYYLHWDMFKVFAGLHGGLYFLDGGDHRIGLRILDTSDRHGDDIYFPLIVSMGAAVTWGPAIIQLTIKAVYLQYDQTWSKIVTDGYELTWMPMLSAGVRF
jgi:hypothetical protein